MSNSYTGRRQVTPGIMSVQPSSGGQLIASSIDAFMQSVGKDIIKQSGEKYGFEIRNQMTQNINKIANENKEDAMLFQESIMKYRNDLLDSISKNTQSRLFLDPKDISAEFDIIASPHVKSVYERHRTTLDNETESAVLSTIDISKNSMLNLAGSLYVDGSTEEDINRQMAIEVVNREGGYVNNPNDSGGRTKFGITEKTLKSLATEEDDISNISKSMATDIVVENYLIKPGINKLPSNIKAQMLDMSVNHGPENAIKILQSSLGIKETGKLDQETIEASNNLDPLFLLDKRINFYRNIVKKDPTQAEFIKGWEERAKNAASVQAREPNDVAQTAAQAIQRHMVNVIQALNATKSDGTPMFTPKQKQTQLSATRDALFQVAAKTWIDQQPNKISAFSQWKNGGVKIAFPDEKGNIVNMNIRDLMSPEIKQKVDDSFMSAIKDEFYIARQIEDKEEKETIERNKQLRNDIIVRIQKGENMSSFVDAARSDLDPDDYIDLRKMALSSDPVTNADVYGNFVTRAYNGEDITAELRIARFNDRTLSNEKYNELMNIAKRGTSEMQNEIEEGRKYLAGSLPTGRESKAEVTKALSEFDQDVQIFREKNGRLPSQRESIAIADNLIPRWSDDMTKKRISQLPRPMLLPENMRDSKVLRNISIEEIEDLRKKTQIYFMTKYNNNVDDVNDDEHYIREMKTFDDWVQTISQRQERKNRIDAMKNNK